MENYAIENRTKQTGNTFWFAALQTYVLKRTEQDRGATRLGTLATSTPKDILNRTNKNTEQKNELDKQWYTYVHY